MGVWLIFSPLEFIEWGRIKSPKFESFQGIKLLYVVISMN